MTFGKWLKDTREYHGLSVKDVHKKAGVSEAFIRLVEDSNSIPTLDKAQQLTQTFNLELWRVLKKIDI